VTPSPSAPPPPTIMGHFNIAPPREEGRSDYELNKVTLKKYV
jgi:hypothetical protein